MHECNVFWLSVSLYFSPRCVSLRHRYLSRRHSCANSRVQNPWNLSRIGVPVAPFELKLGQNKSYGLQEPFKTPPGLCEAVSGQKFQKTLIYGQTPDQSFLTPDQPPFKGGRDARPWDWGVTLHWAWYQSLGPPSQPAWPPPCAIRAPQDPHTFL